MNSILLVNDMAGYGKVALSAMIPILSNMRFQVYNLPTALVSNTLNYGKFDILETTDYMGNCLRVWEELGFDFDTVCTGFLVSERQTKLVADYCERKKSQGKFIFVDPIMGDDGKLYNGVTEQTITYMRKMCGVADLMVPNFTEAAFLADKYIGKEDLGRREAEDLIGSIREMGARSVVITSMKIEGQTCSLLWDGGENRMEVFPYEEIPVKFPGTGDIFSALLIGNHRRKKTIRESVRTAMQVIEELILLNRNNPDKYKGIPIEEHMAVIMGARE